MNIKKQGHESLLFTLLEHNISSFACVRYGLTAVERERQGIVFCHGLPITDFWLNGSDSHFAPNRFLFLRSLAPARVQAVQPPIFFFFVLPKKKKMRRWRWRRKRKRICACWESAQQVRHCACGSDVAQRFVSAAVSAAAGAVVRGEGACGALKKMLQCNRVVTIAQSNDTEW